MQSVDRNNVELQHLGEVVLQRGSLRAIACDVCGYAHLFPLPTQAQLDTLYTDQYYQTYNAGWFEKERKEQWYWRKVYRQRVKYCKRILGRKFVCVLDDGCGAGWFVNSINWTTGSFARGYDPSARATKWGRTKLNALVFNYRGPVIPLYDCVHCSLVLEHVSEPLEYLRGLGEFLRPGGVICVVVPNEFNSLQQRLAKRYGYTPLHEHHVNYFTHISIQALMQRAGFDVVRVAGTFPMEQFALRGLNYVKHPKLGKLAHWLRMCVEWAALVSAPDWWERKRDDWAARGIGRETEVWGVKR